MKSKLFIILLISILTTLAADELPPYKKSINFTHLSEKGEKLNPEDFAGFDELRRWANFQSMSLKIDSDKFGLRDGICRMIPTDGLSFYLTFDTSIKKPIYLYLDLFDRKNPETNPYRITIDPVECPSGRINVTLIPDSTANGRFWGIWDVFYSYVKE